MRPLHALATLALILPGSVLAQSLPTTSPAEQTTQSINNSMARQSEIRGIQQQNQFENNQLRSDIQRSDAAGRLNRNGIPRR